jgi:hypothetical protein
MIEWNAEALIEADPPSLKKGYGVVCKLRNESRIDVR